MKSTMPLKLAMLAGLGLTCAVATTYAPPASAGVVVGVGVRVGPPPPRFERVPPPRRGYVWAPGYWRWNGHRHIWGAGHWARARSGYRYHPAYWVNRRGEWHLHRGYWVR